MGAKAFLRDWALIICMAVGVAAYFVYAALEPGPELRRVAGYSVAWLQPVMIFCMLFLTFCRIDPRELRLCKWHLWLLLIQCGIFAAIGLPLIWMPQGDVRVVLEGAMLCMICPTATAAAVVTRKLGGSIAHVTTYTILINLAASITVPIIIPYVHPNHGMTTLNASLLILGKVFPLLLMPFVGAILLRYLWPKARKALVKIADLPFYIWMVALALAMTVTTKSIAHSTVPVTTQLWLVAVSLLCCVFQFWAGRHIGRAYDDSVSAGQAMGQKNTVFAIWLGFTFFTPITSIVGGFYSIWHNVANSWQLYKHRKQESITCKD